jgi:uncharacterized protein YndB with AHSA1/START domain
MTNTSNMSDGEPSLQIVDGLIVAEIDISATPERVFAAITDPNELGTWWGLDGHYKPHTWNCDVRVGGAWRADVTSPKGQPFHVEGEYLEVSAPHTLVYTWRPSWLAIPETIVRWELSRIADGTRVRIVHGDFGDHEAAARFFGEAESGGWALVLDWLSHHLVEGKS